MISKIFFQREDELFLSVHFQFDYNREVDVTKNLHRLSSSIALKKICRLLPSLMNDDIGKFMIARLTVY